jgi:tetratricopeptide (TPR) repeat protein
MKKLIITAIALTLLGNVMAQQPNFESAIKETLTLLDSAKTPADMQQVIGRFTRITQAENNRWEAFYYLAYTQIYFSFWEKDGDKKDAILDEAQKSIDKALKVNGDKSELYALQGYLYQGRIQVSSMRGMTYSPKAAEVLEKAIKENPENPRAYFLLGQNIYYTPSMFGGGSKNALPKFQKAKELFEKFNGNSGIEPKWGVKLNQRMIDNCLKENS